MKGIKINERLYEINEQDYKKLVSLIKDRFTYDGAIAYRNFARYVVNKYKEIRIHHMMNVNLK